MPDKLNPFKQHNHERCKNSAIEAATKLCEQQNLRFTQIRREVLELVWASHCPVTAYDILRQLRQNKANAEPPTVYRALDFLIENNLIHRIESLNAFIGCDQIGHAHECQFLICSSCNQTIELPPNKNIYSAISQSASEIGFLVKSQVIEIQGVCHKCQ